MLTPAQIKALEKLVALPVETEAQSLLPALDDCLEVLAEDSAVALANVKKFDIYDSYFNVTRTAENHGVVFLTGMLQTYRQMLTNLETTHELTVVELPLLRVGLDTIVWMVLEQQD